MHEFQRNFPSFPSVHPSHTSTSWFVSCSLIFVFTSDCDKKIIFLSNLEVMAPYRIPLWMISLSTSASGMFRMTTHSIQQNMSDSRLLANWRSSEWREKILFQTDVVFSLVVWSYASLQMRQQVCPTHWLLLVLLTFLAPPQEIFSSTLTIMLIEKEINHVSLANLEIVEAIMRLTSLCAAFSSFCGNLVMLIFL